MRRKQPRYQCLDLPKRRSPMAKVLTMVWSLWKGAKSFILPSQVISGWFIMQLRIRNRKEEEEGFLKITWQCTLVNHRMKCRGTWYLWYTLVTQLDNYSKSLRRFMGPIIQVDHHTIKSIRVWKGSNEDYFMWGTLPTISY